MSVCRCASLAALALLSAVGSACTAWQPATVAPESLQGRDVTVYTDSTHARLRDVRLTDTLLVGEEWDNGRETAVRVADIDSVRVRRPDLAKTLIAAIGAPLTAITFIMIIAGPPDSF